VTCVGWHRWVLCWSVAWFVMGLDALTSCAVCLIAIHCQACVHLTIIKACHVCSAGRDSHY
jgi:hypothetical protein